MLSNEDNYRVTLNAIVEILGTKAGRNEDEKNVLKRAQNVLSECNPNVPFWWKSQEVLEKFGKSFTDVFRREE